ncbi:MAG: sigma factor, partial [Candidatus Limnocylindrales bacterium]
VQDAAMQAWRDWRQLRDPDRFDAWFDRIVVNRCRDRRRRAVRVRKECPPEWCDLSSTSDLR